MTKEKKAAVKQLQQLWNNAQDFYLLSIIACHKTSFHTSSK